MHKRIKKSFGAWILSLILMVSLSMEVFVVEFHNNSLEKSSQLEGSIVQLDCEVIGYNELPDVVPYATYFADASITISFNSEGMHITICTGMNGIASVVGVKDIEVHRKKLFGYEVVAVADGGEVYDTTTAITYMVYTGAVQGEKYRVVCTHYGDVEGYRELEADTDWVTCNY